MMESFSPKTGKKVRHCVQENKDLWGSKLRCSCGCGFRKNIWHRYEDRPTSYGYKCYNILNNGSAKQRREAGADDTGYCDQPMIADWKLELMGKAILEQVFREQRDLIHYTINLIRQSYRTQRPAETGMANLTARMAAQYLRLTAEVYPELMKKVESSCAYIVPEVCHERN